MKPLKADLHIHTREDPEDHISYSAYQLIDRAFTKGFDVLAITNHQEVTYGQRLKSYAAERGIVLIPGVEATITGKHVLLINMSFEKRSFTTFKDVQSNKAPNNLVVAPHPYFPSPTCLNGQLEATPEMFDAIEYCHFYSERINFNKPALRFAYKHRLPVVGNSDAHIPHQFGLTYSLVEAEKHPGSYEPGNIAIGADPDQYYPSDEEILVSELGKMVYRIIQMHSKEEIERIKVKDGIKSQIISFNEIKFRHVDVMGSGRFFYADKIDKEVKFEI